MEKPVRIKHFLCKFVKRVIVLHCIIGITFWKNFKIKKKDSMALIFGVQSKPFIIKFFKLKTIHWSGPHKNKGHRISKIC